MSNSRKLFSKPDMTPSRSEATIDYNYTYLVTVSAFQKKRYISEDELFNAVVNLKLLVTDLYLHAYAIEDSGRYNQLHFHAIGFTKRPVYYKYSNKIDNFRVQWKKVFNYPRAYQYVFKQCYNQYEYDNIITSNYYRNNYAWSDTEEAPTHSTIPAPPGTGGEGGSTPPKDPSSEHSQ